MNSKTIRIVIFLAIFTILGVFSFQIFWVTKAHNLQETQFNKRVHVALSAVVQEVQILNDDSSNIYETVKQVSSNYFLVSTKDTLHPVLLERVLREEFQKRDLDIPFEYVIYDCFTDSIVFGNEVDMNDKAKHLVRNISNNDKWNKKSHYFGVYFPTKEQYLIDKMSIWVVSTIFLLLVAIFFSYTIWVILKQKRLSEVRSDFINNMTHELKTPISTISLSTDALSNPAITQDPVRLQNYARIIKEESKRLESQVDRVLQMATLEKRQMGLSKKKINLNEIIENTIMGFQLILDERGGKMETDLKAKNCFIYGDKTHLTNILFNLVDNAIKYTEGRPNIVISTEDHNGGVNLRVKDNGIGMSNKEQKHIFEKFYRVPKGDKHDVKGFGIGLNYVLTMVKKHKGKIQLKSEVGKGSTFKLYFPKAK